MLLLLGSLELCLSGEARGEYRTERAEDAQRVSRTRSGRPVIYGVGFRSLRGRQPGCFRDATVDRRDYSGTAHRFCREHLLSGLAMRLLRDTAGAPSLIGRRPHLARPDRAP